MRLRRCPRRRRREEWALSALFRTHQAPLLRFLRALERPAAEDLAADVWVGVAQRLPTFRGDEAAFARGCSASLALADHRRRAVRRRTDPVPPQALVDRAAAADAATVATDRLAAQEAIDRLIVTLPADQAEVVLLRVVAGLTADEVAKITGRSSGAVRVIQHRALAPAPALPAAGCSAMTASDDLPGDMRRSAFDPDLVERLLDGELEPDDAPDALAGIAALVRTARSPATAAELMDEPRGCCRRWRRGRQRRPEPREDADDHPGHTHEGGGDRRAVCAGRRRDAAAVTASKPKDNSKAGPTTDPIVVTVPTTEPESTLPATVPDTVPETTAGDETTSTTPTAIAAQVAAQGQGPDATGPAAYGLCTAWVPTSATAPSRTAWRSGTSTMRPAAARSRPPTTARWSSPRRRARPRTRARRPKQSVTPTSNSRTGEQRQRATGQADPVRQLPGTTSPDRHGEPAFPVIPHRRPPTPGIAGNALSCAAFGGVSLRSVNRSAIALHCAGGVFSPFVAKTCSRHRRAA